MNSISTETKFFLWCAFFISTSVIMSLSAYHTKKFERLCNASNTLLFSPMSMEYLENLSDLDGYSLFDPIDYTSPYWKERQKRDEIYEAVKNYDWGEAINIDDIGERWRCLEKNDFPSCSGSASDDPTNDMVYAFEELNNLYNNIHNICDFEGSGRVMAFIYRVGNLKIELESFRDINQ